MRDLPANDAAMSKPPAGQVFASSSGSLSPVKITTDAATGMERAADRAESSFCADDARVAYPLFQAEYGGSTPTSALQLKIRRMALKTALDLNRQWHSRLPVLTNGWNCKAFGALCANQWYAVALWGTPVNFTFNGTGTLELRRMAIAPNAPKNTASRMLRIMVLLIRREMPEIVRLISYQDTEVHKGTIYKAAGWVATRRSKFTGWQRKSRFIPNRLEQSRADKVRWEYDLTVGRAAGDGVGLKPPTTEAKENKELAD